jgi:hypothetical protein
METQKTLSTQSNSEQKFQCWWHHTTQFQTILESHNKRFSKEFCKQKTKVNKTMKEQAIPSHRKRKSKKVKSNTDSATHNQPLNQQIQLHDRDHHVFINTNTEC